MSGMIFILFLNNYCILYLKVLENITQYVHVYCENPHFFSCLQISTLNAPSSCLDHTGCQGLCISFDQSHEFEQLYYNTIHLYMYMTGRLRSWLHHGFVRCYTLTPRCEVGGERPPRMLLASSTWTTYYRQRQAGIHRIHACMRVSTLLLLCVHYTNCRWWIRFVPPLVRSTPWWLGMTEQRKPTAMFVFSPARLQQSFSMDISLMWEIIPSYHALNFAWEGHWCVY